MDNIERLTSISLQRRAAALYKYGKLYPNINWGYDILEQASELYATDRKLRDVE